MYIFALIIFKSMEIKYEGKVYKNTSTLGWHTLLEVPSKIYDKFNKAGIKRIKCSIQAKPEFHCAILSNGEGGYYIILNNSRVKQLKLTINETYDIILSEDLSEFGMEMPEEFKEVLNQDIEFEKYFLELNPGVQRNLLYYVSKFKSSDIKIERTLIIADHIKANQGKIDSKMLYEAFKKK